MALGLLHTLTLRADLFDSFNVPAYNNGTWVNDGGLYTVDVANPRSLQGNDYSHTSGASTRWVCEAPSTGVRCRVQIPGGRCTIATVRTMRTCWSAGS